MILTASRGKPFKEEFTFKSASGQLLPVPAGRYVLTLEHGTTTRQFTNLRMAKGKIVWSLPAGEVDLLEYDTMYFTLSYNDQELVRGVLKINDERKYYG